MAGSPRAAARARGRAIARRVALGLLGTLAVAVAGLASFPTGRYLLRAAWEEGRILARRRPIAAIVADSTVPAATRAKLRLVLDARRFAADSIGLRAGESFTLYSDIGRDTLVLVLSGARRDTLAPYTWWFPIVGRVPYKGFFAFDAARHAKADLLDAGLDAYLRPSPAFSTLGWFNDPLLNTTLREDAVDLANTVVHELTHNTFYASGQAAFNESFASFVGARGSAWLFRARGDSTAAAEADRRWGQEKRLAAFWTALGRSLDSAYAAHPADSTARVAARDSVYRAARAELATRIAPEVGAPPTWAARVQLDNASLLARLTYGRDLPVFDAVWEREGRDVRRTVRRVIELARGKRDPFAALRAALMNRR
ncbi:aminopeptidase [Gemmatirosa kalamazoonensis]|uniref:Aminopeptidase n=1 Tax=Gemmatirosa kalamazoonensis TaxID=861299 RepID=W0RIQ5_9BACT|nr:aminopeptidase [Gemmatirosa kalamazoonensis]AHG90195.1 aminopeptidase [Gemmatirosa kalamazoonensis]